jgi:polar amino acid transport system permease protein
MGNNTFKTAWPSALILAMAALWLFFSSLPGLGYHWQWYRLPRYFATFQDGAFIPGPLLRGLAATLEITSLSLIFCFAAGLLAALLSGSRSLLARALAALYVELVRNTPLLVQIFFIYFVIAPVLGISRFWSAVLALSLFEGAYASEIFRAGIASIRPCQWDASYSLGLSTFQTLRHVILPQAVRRVLPPLVSQAVSLVKDSALVSAIAVHDLTMQAQVIASDTFLVFETWFAVAGVYLALNLALSFLATLIERAARLEQ